MKKELLKELQLQAGGSHYPSINPDMQEAFAKLIIAECIKAVQRTDRELAVTSYDNSVVEGTVQRSVQAIKDHFNYTTDVYTVTNQSQKPQTR